LFKQLQAAVLPPQKTTGGQMMGGTLALHVTSVDDIRPREKKYHDRRDPKEHDATHFMIIVGNAK
jgi:hypothetical protein